MKFRLLTGEDIPVTEREFIQVALHRFLLVFYGLITAFIFVSNATKTRDTTPLELRLANYGGSVIVGVGTLFLAVFLSQTISRRRYGEGITHFPLALAAAITVSVLFGEYLGHVLFGDPIGPVWALMLKIFFYIVTVEIGSTFAMHLLLPPILSELRGEKYRKVSDICPPVRQVAADPILDLPERAVPLTGLVRLQADRNHVVVYVDDTSFQTAGPLAKLLDQLPPDAGILVHRSDWVAASAIAGRTRIGRNHALSLRNGDVVRIASSRDKDVAQWLQIRGFS